MFGAIIKPNIDNVPKVYISRNNGFLSVGDFEGNINMSVKFESKKKELVLGNMFNASRNTVLSIWQQQKQSQLKITLIDISGPKVLAYQEVDLSELDPKEESKSGAQMLDYFYCLQSNNNQVVSIYVFSSSGGR